MCNHFQKIALLPNVFGRRPFAEAVVQSGNSNLSIVELGSSRCSARALCGIASNYTFGRRSISLGPFGLYASFDKVGRLQEDVRLILSQLQSFRTTAFQWNVRYDDQELATELIRAGLKYTTQTTHVLSLEGGYEGTFANYNASKRNEVRRIRSSGLIVRSSKRPDDVQAYHEIYATRAMNSGYRSFYPMRLFKRLLDLDDVVFLVAESQGRIIGGSWFFMDGQTVCYWQSAMDRSFAKLMPAIAIIDHAIQDACNRTKMTFNFGASIGIQSLISFKAAWGAQELSTWEFFWSNPAWTKIRELRQMLVSNAG